MRAGCKRALQVFKCIDQDPFLFNQENCPPDVYNKDVDPPLTLKFKRSLLAASVGGSVITCTNFNVTSCKYEPASIEESPPTQAFFQNVGLDSLMPTAPTYGNLVIMAAFFSILYAVLIPVGFFFQLNAGKHRLNHLNFGRRYGYLYKRYEVQYFWWETTVMFRKTILSVVDIFVLLPNGAELPGQQTVAAMCVCITFLLLQAAFTPYAEPHLDALETVLLVVNYTFLFLGLCAMLPLHLCSVRRQCPHADGMRASCYRSGYAIGMESSTAPDRDLQVLLTIIMTIVLAVGFVFMFLFLSLDITLQVMNTPGRLAQCSARVRACALLTAPRTALRSWCGCTFATLRARASTARGSSWCSQISTRRRGASRRWAARYSPPKGARTSSSGSTATRPRTRSSFARPRSSPCSTT